MSTCSRLFTTSPFWLDDRWTRPDSTPNVAQFHSVLTANSPLHLAAGPESSKTRALLWRTLEFILSHDAASGDIFHMASTEKVALQLEERLIARVRQVTNYPHVNWATSALMIG
jgi:superfamily I DNA/RNA helicase